MTLDQAHALAARLLDAIDAMQDPFRWGRQADRDRVTADLDVLIILDGRAGEIPRALWDKLRSYAETNLRRTAASYGLTP